MKKCMIAMLCVICALMLSVGALADTWYVYTKNGRNVNIRSGETNNIVGSIPYGTAVQPDSGRSTEKAAYVTYNGVSGYVRWGYLTQEKPIAKNKLNKNKNTEDETDTESIDVDAFLASGEKRVIAVGCKLQHLTSKGKAKGKSFTELDFANGYENTATGKDHDAGTADVAVTAVVPKGKRLKGWRINGIDMVFTKVPKTFVLKNINTGMVIEAIY